MPIKSIFEFQTFGGVFLGVKIILSTLGTKISRKWLTVAIFRKLQDSSVALWIEIAVILDWRYGLVWFGMVLLYSLVVNV